MASLAALDCPLSLNSLIPGTGAWELEIGFGKGRYLLQRAAGEPVHRFLGIERAGKYFAWARQRAVQRALTNLLLLRGDALYLLAVALPPAFARRVHVYFPDPWPKLRHERRRLLDPESLDLLLGALAPGGRLEIATDHLEYGESVIETLRSHGGLAVEELTGPWPDGARTNYEAKYVAEGRRIVRLEAGLLAGASPLHARGAPGLLAATAAHLASPPREGGSGG
jgi:tRNA (guanine-N7-)-methyltransferase